MRPELIPTGLPSVAEISSSFAQWGPTVIGGAIGATILAKFGGIAPRIPEGFMGMLERGQRPVYKKDSKNHNAGDFYSPDGLDPGTYFTFPYFRSIKLIDTRDQLTDLEIIRISDPDKHWASDVFSTLTWNVARKFDKDRKQIDYCMPYGKIAYRAAYRVSSDNGTLEGRVHQIASGSLQQILEASADKQHLDQKVIFKVLGSMCALQLFEEVGVHMTDFVIKNNKQIENSVSGHATEKASQNIAASIEKAADKVTEVLDSPFARHWSIEEIRALIEESQKKFELPR